MTQRRHRTVGALLLALAAGTAGAGQGQEDSITVAQERKMRDAVALWRAGETREAMRQLDALVETQPDFQAAQLLRSKWLEARSGRLLPHLNGRHPDHSRLVEEIRLRIAPPDIPAGYLPANLLHLPERYRYVIAVDLSAYRLYVLENDGGQLRVVRDFYASIGSAGYGKEVEGDLRTPVGIYHVTRWINGNGLPDLYGSGAFPVDYPNDWDRALGRTGHGIWLHGVPRRAYSRLPRSSEGCVTLSNEDLRDLRSFVDVGNTPVVFSPRLQWRPVEHIEAERESFLREVEAWRQAWESMETADYLDFYADDFHDGRRDRDAWATHKAAINDRRERIEVELRDFTIYDYPGEGHLRLVELEQHYRGDDVESVTRKRIYWRRQADGHWRIERERAL